MSRKRRKSPAKRRLKQNKRLSNTELLERAILLHQTKQLGEAEALYKKILVAEPHHPDALHFYGVLLHYRGHSEQAIEQINKSIAVNPGHPDTHNNLGNIYKEMGKFEQAAEAYRACLALNPRNVDAMSNLGAVLRKTEKFHEALEVLQKAREIAPEHALVHLNLGNVYRNLMRSDEAIVSYREALSLLDPSESASYIASIYRNLSRALFVKRRYDEAIRVLKQWLDYEPGSPIAQHMLAACSGEKIPDRASNAFIEETFDRFSGSFDDVLKQLDYRAPELVAGEVRKHLHGAEKNLNILDAGCGTGLCGPLLRDYAKNLVGVDLSKGMVEKARGREVYDELRVAELTEFMRDRPDRYDLIATADTFCYFGELEAAFNAMCSALTDEGLTVFTVEKLTDPNPDETFRLNPHGRYSHTEDYISRSLEHAGLKLVTLSTEQLRNEGGEPVAGLVVTAQKMPGATAGI
jgi:predicted TPR repeat methyltransferase